VAKKLVMVVKKIGQEVVMEIVVKVERVKEMRIMETVM